MSAHTVIKENLLWVLIPLVFALGIFLPGTSTEAAELRPGILAVETCGAVKSDIYAFGAGMMHQTQSMTTSNVNVSFVNSIENCAVISWNTSMPAATQVIYSKVDSTPRNIDSATEPFLGYMQGSMQNNSGMGTHTAILKNLEPGNTYAYRVINRAHPSALPQIGEERFFTVGATQQVVIPPITPPVVIAPPVAPPVTTAPPVMTPEPVVPSTPVIVTETEEPAPVAQEEARPDEGDEKDESDIIAAATAASSALGANILGESTFIERIKRAFSFSLPDSERLSLSPGLGLFEKDRYIVPSLFFILLLFLLQQLLLPALGVNIERPLMFWMFGVMALAVLAALLGFYYITLVMIAVFLVLLAWYLLHSAGDDSNKKSSQKPSGTAENPKTA